MLLGRLGKDVWKASITCVLQNCQLEVRFRSWEDLKGTLKYFQVEAHYLDSYKYQTITASKLQWIREALVRVRDRVRMGYCSWSGSCSELAPGSCLCSCSGPKSCVCSCSCLCSLNRCFVRSGVPGLITFVFAERCSGPTLVAEVGNPDFQLWEYDN